ncbi:hypothetical protein, conserved [Eimeria tenella]|uniref:Uncharacterized protein n=1 Tax=Eimeria tenella TaxID=5802 RepID=C8TDP7_EIMTE|nr:hypothetical protein, conserved [Eimeria tenella]
MCLFVEFRNSSLVPHSWNGKEILCSEGYFSRYQMGTSAIHCEPCPKRAMCRSEGNVVLRCPVGHYCPTGFKIYRIQDSRSSPLHYLRGEERIVDSSRTSARTAEGFARPCPAGTYSETLGLADSSECLLCPPGFYCPQGSSKTLNCPSGFYCPKGTQSHLHFACPGGTYNPKKNAIDVVECLPCPVGKYCPQGSAEPKDCPPGFKIRKREKKNKKRIKNCEMAGAGSYSEGYGTQAPGPGSHPSMCRKCPSGYSCSSGKKEKCGKGKTSQEGDGACSPCPKGHYCPLEVTTTEMLSSYKCAPGTLCDGEGWSDLSGSKDCPAGHYCPSGVSEAVPCPAGTFNPLPRRSAVSDCLPSRAGTYALEGTSSEDGSGECDPVS